MANLSTVIAHVGAKSNSVPHREIILKLLEGIKACDGSDDSKLDIMIVCGPMGYYAIRVSQLVPQVSYCLVTGRPLYEPARIDFQFCDQRAAVFTRDASGSKWLSSGANELPSFSYELLAFLDEERGASFLQEHLQPLVDFVLSGPLPAIESSSAKALLDYAQQAKSEESQG